MKQQPSRIHSRHMVMAALLSLGLAWQGIMIAAAAPADPLESGFLNPPNSARPQTWWHWMNGNITKVGLADDLKAMKQIGLGGATIVNVDCGIPRGKVSFMSPQWRADFKFAVEEANRLGLKLCVENCAGWSSSGGPWNTVTNAMQSVTTSTARVSGPTNFDAQLPQPPTKLGFYRDIAVLAFPEPRDEEVRMQDFAPVVTASGGVQPGNKLTDSNDATFIRLPAPKRRKPQFVQIEFARPFPARTLTMTVGSDVPKCSAIIQVSDNGARFRKVRSISFGRRGPFTRTVSLGVQPVVGRFWRFRFYSATPARTIPVAGIELSPRLIIENIAAKAGFKSTAVLSAPHAAAAADGVVSHRQVIDLTSKMDSDGRLKWQVPAGKWVILRFGYTPTGVKNHPAPKEGEGLECDKMSKSALDAHWNGFMQKILDDIGPLAGRTLDCSLIDSYEVGGQNWTKDFRREFRKRRGYDLLKFLPVFTDRVVDSPAVSERFLWDVRRTIADLFAENYYAHFADLCRQHGLESAVEPYTGPFESMQCGAPADVVMGEFWTGSHGHRSIKLAASIAHTYGKSVVAAESFTSRPEQGRWQNYPYSLKMLGDLMYCRGLNRYVFHRYAMQPWTNRWPGMTMGQWGFHFERTETWWQQGKPWIDYITRCQFLLQQGRAVADAAYFTGQSAPVGIRVGQPPMPAGYDYDAVDPDVLLHDATVRDGRIVLRSGASYAVLILPPEDVNMTPPMLNCIRKLVRAGATVIGPRPRHSPSLEDYPKCDAQVRRLAASLWGKCDGTNVLENSYGHGHVVWGKSLADVFAQLQLKPDFEFQSANPETDLAYAHRIAGGANIYFVSNQRHQFDSAECSFRVIGQVPELWHPDTGRIEPAPVWSAHDGRTTVRLNFNPAGSVFVIFRRPDEHADHVVAGIPGSALEPNSNQPPAWDLSIGADGSPVMKAWTNGQVELRTAGGKLLHASAADVPAPGSVTAPWTLNFPPHWGAPPSVRLDKLISWSHDTNAGVRYFSGTAAYEKEIDISPDRLSPGRELWLDLGTVKDFAEVSLNGHDFGVLWKPPFRVNITAAAHPGRNQLVVKVTNLWPNRLIGDEHLPPDCKWDGKQLAGWPQWLLEGKPSPTGRLTFTTWHHYTKDSKLLESGLLGPVTLRTAEAIPLRR